MIDVRNAMRRSLREDAALASVIGVDDDGEVKVFTYPLKPNVSAPYVAVAQILVPGVEGVYGDDEVAERFVMQMTGWARTDKEAWSVAVTLEPAIRGVRLQVEPYEHTSTVRYQNYETLYDDEANLWGVVMRYEFFVGR